MVDANFDIIVELRNRYGKIEDIREELGLSRRQICERLFVDPSAWSRWTAGGQDRTPARAYKSLVAMLEEKRQLVKAVPVVNTPPATTETPQNEPTRFEAISLGWKLILILNTVAILYILSKI